MNDETQLLIEHTAYRVADEVCQRYEEKQLAAIKLHAAECPGRSVGKGVILFVSLLAASLGALVTELLMSFLRK